MCHIFLWLAWYIRNRLDKKRNLTLKKKCFFGKNQLILLRIFLISSSNIKMSSCYFLKIKTPQSPAGNLSICFWRAIYPHLLKKFLCTAIFAILFGAIKEIRGGAESRVIINLKVRLAELKKEPSRPVGGQALKILSTVFVSALFFLGSILNLDR